MLWEAGGGLLPPWNEVFGRIGAAMLLFLIVTVILNIFLVRPIVKIIELRRERTKGSVDRSEALRIEAARLEAQYETLMNAAKIAASSSRESERMRGIKEAEEIIAAARKEVKEGYIKSQHELGKKYNMMRETLSTKADSFADEIVQQVLEEKG
jgi:F0F1-type ATP synthase membrane subunit b/b'